MSLPLSALLPAVRRRGAGPTPPTPVTGFATFTWEDTNDIARIAGRIPDGATVLRVESTGGVVDVSTPSPHGNQTTTVNVGNLLRSSSLAFLGRNGNYNWWWKNNIELRLGIDNNRNLLWSGQLHRDGTTIGFGTVTVYVET